MPELAVAELAAAELVEASMHQSNHNSEHPKAPSRKWRDSVL